MTPLSDQVIYTYVTFPNTNLDIIENRSQKTRTFMERWCRDEWRDIKKQITDSVLECKT
ncbi:hypothetical protein PL8927_820005 [Planktothrix serta PCC 8927]|uniref:Uncharacterized protein n=1 Tax=Planktothrix serta PCC 8927 TaxID=671068 RepID=A0A7Z9E419_9CYAN|nr:hypothetical protein [Planktothrix serta]VXD24383.1 hypothetical protein PL8927_820005 [Planktothrix serta PCC 8927]